MDQGRKNILDYHQPTESAFWLWFRPIYAILERHWLLPWKIVAVLLLIYIPTKIISHRVYENRCDAVLEKVKIEDQNNTIAVLKVRSLLKNCPDNKSPSDFLRERINVKELPQVPGRGPSASEANPFGPTVDWTWTDPDGGSVRMLINTRGQIQVLPAKSTLLPINTSVPFSFWIWLHERYEEIQEECQVLIALVFCIVAVIWIAAFVFRTPEQRLKSGLHLFFLSLTMSAMVFTPNNFNSGTKDLEPWICGFAIGFSGLACSFFLPKKGLLKYRRVWAGIFILSLIVLSGLLFARLPFKSNHPRQIDLFTMAYLLDGDEVDRHIPPSIRQSALMPGSRAGNISNRQATSPAMTAEVDDAVFRNLVPENKTMEFFFGGQTGSLSFRPSEWVGCDGMKYPFPLSYATKASQLKGRGFFHNRVDVKPAAHPLTRLNSLLVYCQDGKLITLSRTNWEGELPKNGRKRVFIHDVSAGDGERKYIVIVYEVTIKG